MPHRTRDTWLLFLATIFVYAWFFQGFGFNQNAHFDTVRALVEHHTFEITPYVAAGQPTYTGDVAFVGAGGAGGAGVNQRLVSSKPPGLPIVCAPVYLVAFAIERGAGIDINQPRIVQLNKYLATVWGSAAPAALLVV